MVTELTWRQFKITGFEQRWEEQEIIKKNSSVASVIPKLRIFLRLDKGLSTAE